MSVECEFHINIWLFHLLADMSMKALADDRTPKDSCKFNITPGPCFPMLCLTYCHAQVAAISTGKCSPEGCQCTYCLPSPPLDKTN